MTRVWSASGVSASLVVLTVALGTATGRFDQKLPPERQAAHVLSRLTFGARPGDLEQVRRAGVEKWIDLQLHPDRIAENALLDARLAPLRTLPLPQWQLLAEYPNVPPALMPRAPRLALQSLSPQEIGRLMNCSADERVATLAALDPEMRRSILTTGPPQILDGLPDAVRQEAAAARTADQEERQAELRRLRPPLADLLTPRERRIVNSGTADEKRAFVASLDPGKREQVLRALPPRAVADVPDLRRQSVAARQPQQAVNEELVEQKLFRAVYSNRQLEEVLVDFWMNHFNVFNGKGPARVLLTSFERDAIRPHVFGRFRDMLLATARHPAMLFYLDNWQSRAPRDDRPAPPNGRRQGLNENYGRELLELHTVGVNGGYTQDDVVAVARAFTGWTIYDLQKFAEFQFNPDAHDRKEKIVLGHTIPAMGGEQDGLQVIEILARHPSTAAFISKKLAQRFVADDPPRALVERMAATFLKTDGDLRAVLQTLFASPEFLSEGAWQAKLKSPLEMIVGAARALNAEVTDTFALAQQIADLGQPLYGKLEPTGYPNTGEVWANTASLLGRLNAANALTAGQVAGVAVDLGRFNRGDAAAIARELLGRAPAAATLAAIQEGQPQGPAAATVAALVLGSPDFQRR